MYENDAADRRLLDYARERVEAPAIALLLSSAFSLLTLLVGLAFSTWMLVSGVAEEMRQPAGISKEAQIVIRMTWNVMMEVANVIILIGALQMRRLRSPSFSRMSCILAVIPCLGPCFLLGIPFGIWGLVVLNDPQVQRAFDVGE